MANRSAAGDCTDLVVTFASRPGQIHKPIDVGEWHFPFSELKTLQISPSFIRQHVSIGWACLQQSTSKTANHEIIT
jgi:hypothetical protein